MIDLNITETFKCAMVLFMFVDMSAGGNHCICDSLWSSLTELEGKYLLGRISIFVSRRKRDGELAGGRFYF